MHTKAYTVMSARKKVARTDRSKWTTTTARPHVPAHHAAHHKRVHDADRWEDGWKRTYTDTTERWSDAEGGAADADGEWRAVDGGVLLFYNYLGASCGCARVRGLRCWARVDGGWWWFAVDVGVVTNVG
jgi:hypothetical protein